MSTRWKNFSLKRRQQSVNMGEMSNPHESLKMGDDERIMIMNLVKEGKLSADDALLKAQSMGVLDTSAQSPQSPTSNDQYEAVDREVLNFGIHRYGKNNKCTKCVLQIDCQDEEICFLRQGERQKSYAFDSIRSIDTVDDSTRVIISLKDASASDLEIEAGSMEDKNHISRKLYSIIDQVQFGAPLYSDSLLARRSNIICEGVLEKKGHSAGFLLWAKRYVRILPGEIMYFRVGEENHEGSALSIVPLVSGEVFLKKYEDDGFSLLAKKKEYCFRVCCQTGVTVEQDRDNWLIAVQEALNPSLREVIPNDSIEDTTLRQEMYLNSVVRLLNTELEQLNVILTIIGAPIRAATQVCKVRDIVKSLNEQIKSGLLSWTVRNFCEANKSTNNNNKKAEVTTNVTIENKSNLTPSDFNQDNLSNEEYMKILLPELDKTEPSEEEKNIEESKKIAEEKKRFSMEISTDNYTRVSLPEYRFPDYAKVKKAMKRDLTSMLDYGNLKTNEFAGGKPPPLPPKYLQTHQDDSQKAFEIDPSQGSPKKEFSLNDFLNVPPKENKKKGGETKCEKPPAIIRTNKDHTVEETKDDDEPSTPTSPIPPPPPVPSPPLLVGGNKKSMLPPKPNVTPGTQMKPLFWSKVPDASILSSFWKTTSDRTNAFNLAELERMFQLENQTNSTSVVGTSEKKPAAKTQTGGSLLNAKKAQNLGIFLSGYKLHNTNIKEKLSVLTLNEGGLSEEEIIALRRFQPTEEEREMYDSFSGNLTELTAVDKFMLKLCNIRHLNTRLDILLTVREMPEQIGAMQQIVAIMLQSSTCLSENAEFRRFLEYILSLGNYVNGGTNRGAAHGFKLSALSKIADIRSSTDKKSTLLDYLVQQLVSVDYDAVTCYRKMPSLMQPVSASLKGLQGEVQTARKELDTLDKKLNNSAGIFDAGMSTNIHKFVADYTEQVGLLEMQCQQIQNLSVQLKREFGESSSTNFEEWLSSIGGFLKQLELSVQRCAP